MRPLASLILVMGVIFPALAQMPRGVTPYYISPLEAPGYVWKSSTDGWQYLYEGQVLRGAYSPRTGEWQGYDGKTWVKNQSSPAAPKVACPQIDRDAVLRMGDHVQHVDGTIGDGDRFVRAMGPPESDAGKWFVSVVMVPGCPGWAKLKKEWAASEQLMALAKPDDQKASWAHFNAYSVNDDSQKWRWGAVKLSGFPTVLVQPPRTGQYGDPSTIVFQQTYGGDPNALAASMRDAIKRYVSALPKKAEPIGTDPPWKPVPKNDPPPSDAPLPNPNDHVRIPPDDKRPTNLPPWAKWVGLGGVGLLLVVLGFRGKLKMPEMPKLPAVAKPTKLIGAAVPTVDPLLTYLRDWQARDEAEEAERKQKAADRAELVKRARQVLGVDEPKA